MPREVQTQVNTRQVYQPISEPQAKQVVAQPTDQLTLPIQDPDLIGLVKGLTALQPSLQKYVVNSGQANANRDMAAGSADRQMGKPVAEGSTDWYKHAYMMQDGQVNGDKAGNELLQAVATGFNRDTGDINSFIQDHFQKDTQGITDHSYMEGYNESIAPHIQKVRLEQLQYQQDAVVEKVESNGMYKMDKAFQDRIATGEPITVDDLEAARKDLNSNFGISNARFNELSFTALDNLGKQGNYAVYDALREKKPDGTPGMYNIPAWKARIDSAQIHSQNVFLAKRSAADAALKKEREDHQDTALYGVFLKMDTDPAAAKVEYAKLRREGLFSRASDIIDWDNKFNAASKRDASAAQQDMEVSLQQGIYTGKSRPQEIVQADITPAQKRSLMGEWYRVKNDNRQAAAAGQTAADSIYRTQDFRSGETYIETVLRPQASPLDPMGIGTEFARQQLAAARREFTIRSRDVKAPYCVFRRT